MIVEITMMPLLENLWVIPDLLIQLAIKSKYKGIFYFLEGKKISALTHLDVYDA